MIKISKHNPSPPSNQKKVMSRNPYPNVAFKTFPESHSGSWLFWAWTACSPCFSYSVALSFFFFFSFFYDPTYYSPPGSSVHGILQARILEWVATPFSRGIFSTQRSNLGFLCCREILYGLSHQGSHPANKCWLSFSTVWCQQLCCALG